MRRLVLLAAAAPIASLLVAGASATASTTAVTFTGSIQRPAGSGTLIVQAEQGHNVIDPRVLTDVQVASEKIDSGTFSIAVPQSAAVTKAEVNGWVPFVLTVESGRDVTVQNISVPLAKKAANGNIGVARQLTDHVVALPPFGAFYKSATRPLTSPSLIYKCDWVRYGSEKERTVRIAQMHLTKLPRLTMAWDYGTEADTTMSIGYSFTASGDWSTNGTYTATNTIGSDSGFSATDRHDLRYIDGQAYFQRYQRNSLCGKPYKNELDHVVGNSWIAGTGRHHSIHPQANPYHGCLISDDPYGNARVKPGTHFSSDRATASTISHAASAFGFSFSQSTGFTSHIHHDYINHSRETVYVCGKGYMPDVPTLYNNKT